LPLEALVAVVGRDLLDDATLPSGDLPEVDVRRLGEDALVRGVLGVVDDLRDLEQSLRGHAAVEGAVAAEARFTLDERDVRSRRARR
jgi:hypothetical protein